MRPGLGCTRTDEGTEGGSLSTREAVGVAAAGKDDVLLVGSGELLACSGECRSGSMTGSGGIEVGSSPGRREPVAIAGSEEGSEAVIGVGREVGSEVSSGGGSRGSGGGGGGGGGWLGGGGGSRCSGGC